MLLGSECNINGLGDEGTPLYQLVKGKTISRPQALAILDKYELFINGLQWWWPDAWEVQAIQAMWKQYHKLMSLMVQADVLISK